MTSSADDWSETFNFLDESNQLTCTSDIVVAVAEKLKVKKTIAYIVCGLLFRKVDGILEILMMQEAREDCCGTWYLPAGRLEPNETLEEGMQREVVEETGVVCQSEGLVSVETSAGASNWFRFTFLAKETGGSLKTVADEESLCAAWYPVEIILNRQIQLRGSDILKLVKLGADFYECQNRKLALSINRPISKLLCRLCVVHTAENSKFILVRNVDGSFKLPVVEYSQKQWFGVCIHSIHNLFSSKVSVRILSCISVESYPKPAYEHDGFCVTLLCDVSSKETLNCSPKAKTECYQFQKCDDNTVLQNLDTWSKYGCKLF